MWCLSTSDRWSNGSATSPPRCFTSQRGWRRIASMATPPVRVSGGPRGRSSACRSPAGISADQPPLGSRNGAQFLAIECSELRGLQHPVVAAVPNIDQVGPLRRTRDRFSGWPALIRSWPVIRSRRLTLRRLMLGLAWWCGTGTGFATVRWRELTLPPRPDLRLSQSGRPRDRRVHCGFPNIAPGR